MTKTAEQYERFVACAQDMADLNHAMDVLSWDQEVCMPVRGAEPRARAQGTLAGMAHERLTAPEFVDLVTALEAADLDGDAGLNVREVAREQARALRLPKTLVVELSRTESLSHEHWVDARKASEFSRFQPWLEKIVDLKRQVAEAVGYEGSIYNALFDEYEPHARVETVAPLLAELRQRLVPLVQAVLEAGRPADPLLSQPFDVVAQEAFGRRIVADMGFDMEAGRLDRAVHPFCSGTSPRDVRLTTRYNAEHFTDALFGTMHETGHGLYEQGLPETGGLPAGAAISLGIHESQSRLWENFVGRSRSFWVHYLPEMQARFPDVLAGVDVDRFHAVVNHVAASCIRVEADEVTYNLHVLLRFELEQALLEGELAVADLPGVWNERMESYLGIRPPDDARGVLQDVHWSSGLFGYFPTYTLGTLYAAQFWSQAQADLKDLPAQLERGELAGLLGWLREHVHAKGRRRAADELVREVTGAPLSVDPLMAYLEDKYRALYGLG